MRMRFQAVILLSASVAGAAPGGFIPGEGLTFDLTVGPIPAGRARMSVGAPESIGGRRLAAVAGEAHSAEWLRVIARLDDEYKVIFDADTILPRTVRLVESGIRDRTIVSTLDGAKLDLDYTAPKEKQRQARRLPGVVRDPVTALFMLRAAPLTDGERIEMLVLDGFALYRATGRVAGRERLQREGGNADAIRVEVEALRVDDALRPTGQPLRRITLWLSDDDRRVPYRVEGDTDLGRATVELTSYREGAPLAAQVSTKTPKRITSGAARGAAGRRN